MKKIKYIFLITFHILFFLKYKYKENSNRMRIKFIEEEDKLSYSKYNMLNINKNEKKY